MNNQQRENIHRMRSEGYSYMKIAEILCLSENTIKSYCRRNNLGGAGKVKAIALEANLCRQCGAQLKQMKGKKQKKFCSDKCRMAWWNAHPEAVNRKNTQTFTCTTCGITFEGYGKRVRKYCSRICYGKSREGKA